MVACRYMGKVDKQQELGIHISYNNLELFEVDAKVKTVATNEVG